MVLPHSSLQRTQILPNPDHFVPMEQITHKTLPGPAGMTSFSRVSTLVQCPAQLQFLWAFLAMPLQVPRAPLSDHGSHKNPTCKWSQGSRRLRVGLTLCLWWDHTAQDRGMATQTRL